MNQNTTESKYQQTQSKYRSLIQLLIAQGAHGCTEFAATGKGFHQMRIEVKYVQYSKLCLLC